MRLFLAFVMSISSLNFCYGQETERKVIRSKNGDKEEFFVLKSDNSIKHGEYEKKGNYSHVIGSYKNGLRDGMWTEYSTGSRLRSKGSYVNNERVGLWKFYSWEGELEQEYNFSTKELISDNLLDGMKARKFSVIKGNDTLLTLLERPPLYITGKTRMQSALTKGSQIGIILRLTQVSGNVVVGFTIDTAGHAKNYKILSGIHDACDEEALRMVKNLPANWLPAKLNGELVEVEHTITIAFKNTL
ncbi:MAG: hypothetical protein EOO10_18975 [Chitinophagaceae bacterium]|nr:MAG: hypothetical protein EOO10_18975 [Chitinophagaceae bacterium]